MINRLQTLLTLIVALFALTACESNPLSFGSTPAASTQTAAPATASVLAANPSAPGSILFVIKPSQVGNYYGWQMELRAAEQNKGFKPFITNSLNEGYVLRTDLWPDRYWLRVLLRGDVELNQWIDVQAGETRVVVVDIGFLMNDITVLARNSPDLATAQQTPPREVLSVAQTYDPLNIVLKVDLVAKYNGPRKGDTPYGEGEVTLLDKTSEIGKMPQAVVQNGRLTGDIVFKDGRTTTARLDESYSFPEGTRTSWPNGTHFEGRYYGVSPTYGTMTWPNGARWTGPIADDRPSGSGQATTPDGTVFEKVPGMNASLYNGAYPCTLAGQAPGTCYFVNGEQLASEADYLARLERVKREAEAATAVAAAKAAEKQANSQSQPAAAPSASQPIDGCTYVEGEFGADAGLSKLTLDGRGSGHLWQQTYGGATTYTMDIDFTYSGTRNSMSFNYQPAEYRDASGALLRTIPVPGGTGDCDYDGRNLTINGKVYTRS